MLTDYLQHLRHNMIHNNFYSIKDYGKEETDLHVSAPKPSISRNRNLYYERQEMFLPESTILPSGETRVLFTSFVIAECCSPEISIESTESTFKTIILKDELPTIAWYKRKDNIKTDRHMTIARYINDNFLFDGR